MGKQQIKRTKGKELRRLGVFARIRRVFLKFLARFFAKVSSFFFERRKGFVIAALIFFASLSLIVSFRYVQAKLAEADTFSDVYILEKVGAKIVLPDRSPLSLVRVEDAEKLKKEHAFYKEVKEGHYIIAYPRLFVIYDAVHDEVIGIKESMQKSD